MRARVPLHEASELESRTAPCNAPLLGAVRHHDSEASRTLTDSGNVPVVEAVTDISLGQIGL